MTEQLVARPGVAGLDVETLEDAWLSLVTAADRHEFGGAVALVARHGQVALYRATGWAVREPASQRSPMGEDTIFDLASLTKVTATTRPSSTSWGRARSRSTPRRVTSCDLP